MPDFLELKTITVNVNDKELKVQVIDYVDAKTKDLIAFGYSNLKKEDVLNSVRRIINKEKLTDIIDHFIQDDIILDDECK